MLALLDNPEPNKGVSPRFEDFSFRPTLLHNPLRPPPNMDDGLQSFSSDELRCLQALGRMVKGNEHEVAVMADLSMEESRNLLDKLENKGLVEQTNNPKTKRGQSKPTQLDLFPYLAVTIQRFVDGVAQLGRCERSAVHIQKGGSSSTDWLRSSPYFPHLEGVAENRLAQCRNLDRLE